MLEDQPCNRIGILVLEEAALAADLIAWLVFVSNPQKVEWSVQHHVW